MPQLSSVARLAVVAALLAAGCKDSSGPDHVQPAVQGTFDATAAGGAQLPVLVREAMLGGETTWMLSATLDFSATPGRVIDTRVFESRNRSGDPVAAPTTVVEDLTYRRDGSVLIVDRVYGAQQFSDTGSVDASGLLALNVHNPYNVGPYSPSTEPKSFAYVLRQSR